MIAPERRRRLLVVASAIGALVGTGCARSGSDSYRPVEGGNPSRGAQALVHYGCGACHVIPGIPDAAGMVGPPLTAFARRGYIAGEVINTQDNLIRWIEHPQAIESGTAMPDLGVTEQEARDMTAYLYTLH